MIRVSTSLPRLRTAIVCIASFSGMGGAASQAVALDVISTIPGRYALSIPQSLPRIEVVFDEEILVPSRPIRVAGVMSGLETTGTWSVEGNKLVYEPGAPFLPGEKVRVQLHRSIEGAISGTTLTGGFYFSFTIESASSGGDFTEYGVYEAAVIPYFIHGGDLDEDGRPDVAVPNEGTDDVSVFLNDSGVGVFDARTDYGVGQKPSSIFGEDLNDDGWQDLATADIQGSTMTVLLNNGDGTFAPGTSYPTDADDCRQVHGADLDGDLDVDLVATSHVPTSGQGQIWVFYNRGNGTFFPGFPLEDVADGSFTVEVEDYDLDGRADIAVGCREADMVTILLNDGAGNFAFRGNYPAGNGPWDTDANDMDGDGDVDLLMADSFGNRLAVCRNDGTGAFTQISTSVTSAFPLGVHAADIDGDGDIDAISSNFSGGNAEIFRNNGAGSLSLWQELEVQLTGSYPWASDLDGDLDLDVAVVDENSDLLFIFYNGDIATDGPASGPQPLQTLVAAPNPMRTETGTSLRLVGVVGDVDVWIVSPAGRVVRRLTGRVSAGEEASIVWDGRDEGGRSVAPGRYFLRARVFPEDLSDRLAGAAGGRDRYAGEVLVLD